MNLTLQLVVLFISLFLNGFIFYMIKNGILEIRYTVIWIITGIVMLVFSLCPSLVIWLTKILNISTPVNMLFFFGIVFVIIMLLGMTIIVSGIKKKLYSMAQKMAILEKQVQEINEKEKNKQI